MIAAYGSYFGATYSRPAAALVQDYRGTDLSDVAVYAPDQLDADRADELTVVLDAEIRGGFAQAQAVCDPVVRIVECVGVGEPIAEVQPHLPIIGNRGETLAVRGGKRPQAAAVGVDLHR